MLAIIQFFAFILLIVGFISIRMPRWLWVPVVPILLVVFSLYGRIPWWALAPLWMTYLVVFLLFNIRFIRTQYVTKPILNSVKKLLPPMSATEREALNAGDVWWEAELFRGHPRFKKLVAMPKPGLTSQEQLFIDNQVEVLCSLLNDWKITYEDHDLPKEVWDYLKKERFFGMIIPKKYGGLGFSALAHSTVIVKIATASISTAVNTMVPNSLGPGELLFHYGTEIQKNYYLPRLARGEEIPCFALTAPDAGSDAAAIPDTGVICRGNWQGEEIIGIRLNWNKRYITLAPIATVLGLAFKLFDPEHLLGNKQDIGITVCLIPTNMPGVEVGKRHFPMNMAFLNGPTRGQDVFIPLDWIIGGVSMAGQGWRMLMECLSIGRGISLPSLSTATGELCYRMTGAYARIRNQFNSPIGKFEGVEEALARIGGFTYLLEACRVFSVGAVDMGVKPAVASAIAKYHMTEIGRRIINDAMDIHGGRAVQSGPRNYLGHAYQSMPISITVEGANILTRNLIIFGQGAVRCHPYISKEMDAMAIPDEKHFHQFDKLLLSHIGYATRNFARTLIYGLTRGRLIISPLNGKFKKFYRQLIRMSAALALVSDVAMIFLGGNLKRRERLSARLGDVLSYLYLASSIIKYYYDQGKKEQDSIYVEWGLTYCLNHIYQAFDEFFANFSIRWVSKILRFVLFPFGDGYKLSQDALSHEIAASMLDPSELRDRLTKHCYLGMEPTDPLQIIEHAFLKVVAAEPAAQKIRRAISDGRLQRQELFAKQIEIAKDALIITAAEAHQLYEAEQARWNAIQVDEFEPEYFSKGNQHE